MTRRGRPQRGVGLRLTGSVDDTVSNFEVSRRLGRTTNRRLLLMVVFIILGGAAVALLSVLTTNGR